MWNRIEAKVSRGERLVPEEGVFLMTEAPLIELGALASDVRMKRSDPRIVTYDIQLVGSVKTALFGGEGLFFATLRGPGRVWLQSLPFSRLASRIYAAAPQTGGRRREEGSILGGLGNLLDGDG